MDHFHKTDDVVIVQQGFACPHDDDRVKLRRYVFAERHELGYHSPGVKLRTKPFLAEAQKAQFTAQPTCDDKQIELP